VNFLRRSGSQLALLIMGILGAVDAIYLTLVHYDDQVTLACPNTGFVNCTSVITSKYSYVPGTSIPITWPGLAWCLVIVALALAGLFLGAEWRWLRIAEFAWTFLGMLTVLYLVYAEIVQIRNICIWCTVLHVLILLMFLVALVRLPGRLTEEEEEPEAKDEVRVVQEAKIGGAK
jgi:uncharacterized membrane protein